MKVAILGSGFGLYGYLPALVQQGAQVILLSRYRSVIERRRELQNLMENIVWANDDSAALDSAEAVVLTRRPSDQFALIPEVVKRSNLARVLLEKPIAVTPADAIQILDQLSRSAKIVRIGYTFRYTKWAEQLLSARVNNGPIDIEWQFTANHYEANLANWKRCVSEGGGVIRFFGIHLIALLSELGYTKVEHSRIECCAVDEASRWDAAFTGAGRPVVRVTADSRSTDKHFHVTSKAVMVKLADPFDEYEPQLGIDWRVPGLNKLCDEFLSAAAGDVAWYRESVELWDQVEKTTQCVRV